jgi:hypothetical protein
VAHGLKLLIDPLSLLCLWLVQGRVSLPSVLVENLSTAEEFKFNNSGFPINNFLANQLVKAAGVTFRGIYVTFGGNITTLRGHIVTFRGDRSRVSAQLRRCGAAETSFGYRNLWELPTLKGFRDRNFLGTGCCIVTFWGRIGRFSVSLDAASIAAEFEIYLGTWVTAVSELLAHRNFWGWVGHRNFLGKAG